MKAGRRKKTVDPPVNRAEESYARKCLGSLARVLVHSGHSPAALVQEFIDVCRELGPSRQKWDDEHLAYMADLGHVITHWHSHPKYLTEEGKPLPLPLKGPGKSLYSLIERALPERDPIVVAESLQEAEGIRKIQSTFVPTGRYLKFKDHLDSGRHGLMALLGMLETVEYNALLSAGKPKRIERTAINPRFPVSALPAIYEKLTKLTEEFLDTADKEMGRDELAVSSPKAKRLGIGVFTFEESSEATRRDTAQPSSSRRRPRPGRRKVTARQL